MSPNRRFETYAELNKPPSRILYEIKHRDLVKFPAQPREPRNRGDKAKYCNFHRSSGHDTDECLHLKRELGDLAQQGKLNPYLQKKRRDPPTRSPDGRADRNRPLGVIHTIAGGHAAGGTSQNARKRYERQLGNAETSMGGEKRARKDCIISFSAQDLEGVAVPHDDALVIKGLIANYEVARILVDNGSSSEILYLQAFEKMGIARDRLKPVNAPLVGFNGSELHPEGSIELPVMMGTAPRQVTVLLTFYVIKAPSSYNAILGRTGLNALQAIVSTYHLKMKFPTPLGVGEARGTRSKRAIATSLRSKEEK